MLNSNATYFKKASDGPFMMPQRNIFINNASLACSMVAHNKRQFNKICLNLCSIKKYLMGIF